MLTLQARPETTVARVRQLSRSLLARQPVQVNPILARLSRASGLARATEVKKLASCTIGEH